VVTTFENMLAPPDGSHPLEGKILVFSTCRFVNEKTGRRILSVSKARAVIGYDNSTSDAQCNLLEPILYALLARRQRVRVGEYGEKLETIRRVLGMAGRVRVFAEQSA
jgi:hypothetical protein